jgi:hypothetical protein
MSNILKEVKPEQLTTAQDAPRLSILSNMSLKPRIPAPPVGTGSILQILAELAPFNLDEISLAPVFIAVVCCPFLRITDYDIFLEED